jgi:hypothetical protein
LVAQFEGSWLTTEGGSLLLRHVDRKIGLLRQVGRCFTDYRQPNRIAHRLEEMLAQRRSTVIAEHNFTKNVSVFAQSHFTGVASIESKAAHHTLPITRRICRA